jgi:acetylornithine deacetylase/succinyl-diaminopimelate desuccinylase-like protein
MGGQPLTSPDAPAATAELEAIVRTLSGWERPSASEGERRAAQWIAGRLKEAGLDEVRIEEEPAHGGYWWPLGLLSLGSGIAALFGGRLMRLVVGAAAALGIWDELALLRGVWTRRLLRRRRTTNVVGELGRRDAPACIVLIAHHDAAHSGRIFDPTVTYAFGRRFPKVIERLRAWPRIMGLVIAGPILVALGSRRLGAALSLGSAAAFANIGRSGVVDGANDNLSGVAALIAVARQLAQAPPEDARVILLSAGSEESFEEGSQAFLARHGASLPAGATYVIAIDAVGSPYLLLVEGEGMLQRLEYDVALKYTIEAAAHAAGIEIVREHWLSFGSDALAGLRAGYPSVLVASFDDMKLPANYHWPTDVADNLDFQTVAQAATVVAGAVRMLAADGPGATS